MATNKTSRCPFCKKEGGKIEIFLMGKGTAFFDADCCGIDVEIKWTDKMKEKYGKFVKRSQHDTSSV